MSHFQKYHVHVQITAQLVPRKVMHNWCRERDLFDYSHALTKFMYSIWILVEIKNSQSC